MVRLFLEACRLLLERPPAKRYSWLAKHTRGLPAAAPLLTPILERFDGQAFDDLSPALAVCRQYATAVTTD
jgi:hypothetical protein